MHMIVHFALMTTALLIVAYFLFYTASKTSGLTSAFGRLLGLWLLLLAAVFAGGVVTAHMNDGKPYGMDFHMGRHHHRMPGHAPDMKPPPPPPAPAPEQPAPPAAPATPG